MSEHYGPMFPIVNIRSSEDSENHFATLKMFQIPPILIMTALSKVAENDLTYIQVQHNLYDTLRSVF